MKVLLICAPNSVPFYASPQLGVFRIGHHLEKSGLNCDIFDPNMDEAAQWPGEDYGLIGVSGNNMGMQQCLDLVHHFQSRQKRAAFLAAGGITPTYNYNDWLDCGFDAVVLGYGEEPLAALARAADRFEPDRESVLSRIAGLAWRGRDGETRVNPARPLTAELFNRLSYENMLDINIPYEKYWALNEKVVDQLSVDHNAFIVKTIRLFTSSQCPNRCGYCPSKFLSKAQGSPARRLALEPGESLELIRLAWERHGCDLAFFNDEEFLCDKETAKELCRRIVKAKEDGLLPRQLVFQCQSRAVDFLTRGSPDREMLALLDRAGFNRISLGVENICERLLATPVMNKAQYRLEDIRAIVAAFKETSIALTLNFMLLVPETTREELLANLKAIFSFLDEDVLILLNLHILAAPGASAVESGAYELAMKKVTSPLNGWELEIPDRFRLRDPGLREGLNRLDGLIAREMDEFLKSIGSRKECIATTSRAVVLCLALLKMMDEPGLYAEFRRHLQRNAAAAP